MLFFIIQLFNVFAPLLLFDFNNIKLINYIKLLIYLNKFIFEKRIHF